MPNDSLVLNNINLVHKICHDIQKWHHGIEYEEIFSEGCLALVEASQKYKPSHSHHWAKFSTFAYHCIKNHLNRFIKNLQKSKPCISISLVSESMLGVNDDEYNDIINTNNNSPGTVQALQLYQQGYTLKEIANIVVFPNGKKKTYQCIYNKIKLAKNR